jgi:hypothetical protein
MLAVTLAALMVLCLYPATSFGQCTLSSPTTWAANADGNWSISGNWSGGVPTSSTETCITDGISTVTLDVNGSTADLQIAGGNTLSFNSSTSLNIGGMLTNGGNFLLNGPGNIATIGNGATNSGIVDLEDGSTLTVVGDVMNSADISTTGFGSVGGNTLNITGMLTNQAGATFVLLGGGPGDMATISGNLTNLGYVNVEGASTLAVNGTVDNSGYLFTNGDLVAGGNTITTTGMLTNEATGQIMLNGNGGFGGAGDMLQAASGITNNGAISVSNASSVVSPFVSNGGTITIDDTSTFLVGTGTAPGTGYVQLANGTLYEIITPGGSGVITVDGSAILAGTLNITLQTGFNPAVGSTYQFLFFTPGLLNGTFDTILNQIFNNGTEMWMINYDNTDGYVELIAANNNGTGTPEPATLQLLIPGLMVAGYGLRRRLAK